MRSLRIIGGVCALGVLGGLLYLGQLALVHAIPEARAGLEGSGGCGPGKPCAVTKLKATTSAVSSCAITVPTNASTGICLGATNQWQMYWNGGGGSADFTSTAAYRFLLAGTLTTSQVHAGNFVGNAASGSTALDVLTTGAKVSFGGGTTDYCDSDGTNVRCLNIVAGVQATKDAFDFASITAGTCSETTATASSDVIAGDICVVGASGTYVAGIILNCFVSDAATDTITLRACCNNAAVACDPASQNYKMRILKQ